MPLKFAVDHAARIIRVRAFGTFGSNDVRDYQLHVRALPEHRGFHEIFDLSSVERIEYISGRNVRELAELAASNDSPAEPTYLAIVAPHPTAFGLARMYQTYRDMAPHSTRIVRIFRSCDDAEQWVGQMIRTRAAAGVAGALCTPWTSE
ncbi:MAG TPA: hypothetical protein VNN55_08655 [bacterium]|nr:hypothetical protein [bacterium]